VRKKNGLLYLNELSLFFRQNQSETKSRKAVTKSLTATNDYKQSSEHQNDKNPRSDLRPAATELNVLSRSSTHQDDIKTASPAIKVSKNFLLKGLLVKTI